MEDGIAAEGVLGSVPEVSGEVMPGLERRRRWSVEEKLRVLAQSVAPGSSPTLTWRMHGISSGQLYTWRKQFRLGELSGFVPVSIAQETTALWSSNLLTDPPRADPAAGVIEVELPTGVKLRVPGNADEGSLRRILSVLS